jgi:serine/threonine-protein kinase RsbT
VPEQARVLIHNEADIVTARQTGRSMAAEIGFSGVDLTLIATAISEITRNIVKYAGRGEISFWVDDNAGARGLVVRASDEGPGIPDLKLAMQDGYSTKGGLGLGLPGARRLMDDFAIESEPGKGTVVTLKKWARAPRP